MPVLKEFSLDNKLIVVCMTKAPETSYLCKYLLFAGAELFLLAQTDEVLNKAREVLGTNVSGKVIDLQSRPMIVEARDHITTSCGTIDGLVIDSRNTLSKPMGDVDEKDWSQVMDSNAKSTFFLYQIFGECMKNSGYGRIVNITSQLGDRSVDNFSVYSASQAAIHSLTKSMTVEYSKYSIRINTIATGWTSSEEIDLEEQQKELLVRFIPLRRKGIPSDLGPLLVFLCSESCDYTTGQPIFLNGGLTARP